MIARYRNVFFGCFGPSRLGLFQSGCFKLYPPSMGDSKAQVDGACKAPLYFFCDLCSMRPMKPQIALKYYGSREAMRRAAGVSKQAVSQWFKVGLVPTKSAIRLSQASKGKLEFKPSAYA